MALLLSKLNFNISKYLFLLNESVRKRTDEVGSIGIPWWLCRVSKYLALSLLSLGLLLWHEFDPWPRNFHMPLVWPKKRLAS